MKFSLRPTPFLLAFALTSTAALVGAPSAQPMLSASEYPSIQEAITRNPGQMIFVPAGDYSISEAIHITTAGSGLWGPGRIIQTNPESEIVTVSGADGVQLRDITLTRAEGKKEGHHSALSVTKCADPVIANVRVIDNWSNSNAVSISNCRRVQVRGCLIQNYSRISIDDRTASSFMGYAFNCIDGTGLSVSAVTGARIVGNRVIELRMLPTKELKAKYNLGKYVKKNAVRGWHASPEAWKAEYFNGWHQGSAIVVNSGETTNFVQIIANYIENAAQGIDIHGDHVIMAQNVINDAFIGMKAVHGSRNVAILANQFSKNDLWAINVSPGSASHAAGGGVELSHGRHSSAVANIDGESIVAGNIISDFGYGREAWNWNLDTGGMAPLRLGTMGFAERGRPVVRDVIVQDNVVYDTGRDQVLVDGKPRVEPPRYRYTVKIATGRDMPTGLVIAHNILDPGTNGIVNPMISPDDR